MTISVRLLCLNQSDRKNVLLFSINKKCLYVIKLHKVTDKSNYKPLSVEKNAQ